MKLKENEAVILVDFSENFVGKYNREIHSVHLGSAKTQITLHTGVLYHNNISERKDSDENIEGESSFNSPKCILFCSISSSLRQDPSAIWAHIMPVLKMLHQELPLIDTVHFQSDGPCTQYRNKKNFYLMTHFSNKFGFKYVSWNLTEAGHGKSTADGIGAVLQISRLHTVQTSHQLIR